MKVSAIKSAILMASILIHTGCGNDDNALPETDQIDIQLITSDQIKTVIDTESVLLAGPVEIISVGEAHVAIMDRGLNRVMVFDLDGNETYSFGGTGSGPGEWDQMSGAGNLTTDNERFVVSNRSAFRFDVYDYNGNYVESISYPQYMNYESKSLLSDGRLLVATSGEEGSLAAILNLEKDGEIEKTFGDPEPFPGGRRNFEVERTMLAEGQIPPRMMNESLVQPLADGFVLLMNAMGELRFYNENGSLEWSSNIPEEITAPVLEFTILNNKENAAPHTVFPLRYAFDMQVYSDQIYILTTANPEEEYIKQHLLIFDSYGTLLEHYKFDLPAGERIMTSMVPYSERSLLFTDPMNSELVEVQLEGMQKNDFY
jgi:hypothetical protein